MDCMDFRDSGELSDIRIIVDATEFNLHKFPLYVRSNYFKSSASNAVQIDQTDKLTIKLESFPGGAKTFALIADYCYNKEINVNATNVIDVKCAAEFLEMNSNGKGGLCMFADNIIFDLLHAARSKRDCMTILKLLDESLKYKDITEKCKLNLRLLDALVEYLSSSIKLNSAYNNVCFNKNELLGEKELKIVSNLPINWFLHLVKSKVHIGTYVVLLSNLIENYIDHNTALNSSGKSIESLDQEPKILQPLLKPLQIDIQVANSHASNNSSFLKTSSPAVSPIPCVAAIVLNDNEQDVIINNNKDDEPKSKMFSDVEKLDIIRQIAVAFNQSYSENQLTLSWLLIYMNTLNKLNADNDLKGIFLKWIWQAFNNFKKDSNELNSLPSEIMTQLIQNIIAKEDLKSLNIERVSFIILFLKQL